MQTLRWRQLGLGFGLVLLSSLTSVGCVTGSVIGFMSDEVRVRPAVSIDVPATEVRLALKNILGRPDGPYSLKVLGAWSQSSRQENVVGVLELMPPHVHTLESMPPGDRDWVATGVEQAIPKEAIGRQIPNDRLLGLGVLGATVERSESGMFRIAVFGQDEELRRWVSVGALEFGPGTQSAARPVVGAILLPLAVVVDVMALPVYRVMWALRPT